MAGSTPIVGILANSTQDSGLDAQMVDDKYLRAALDVVGAVPLILPTLYSSAELDRILPLLDGIILTGDASNLQPGLYGQTGTADSHGPFDVKRDKCAIELITMAFEEDIPLLGICRGMQEMNVALGGNMRRDVNENDAFTCHRPVDYSLTPDERYGPAHRLTLAENGLLARILGQGAHAVNSLHEQAVDELADGLVLDAMSEDGVIEAFHHPDKRFFLGVQWHAEYAAHQNDISTKLFKAFGKVIRNQG